MFVRKILKQHPYTNHDKKKTSIFWSQKFTTKFWQDFWPGVGDLLSKNTLTRNIDGSNLFDIFWPVSIFWQLFNILTRVWAPVKILIENSVLRRTFSQNQSYGNGSIRIKHFQHKEFWSKFGWNVSGQYGVKRQKSHQKLDVHFLLQNIDCFFLSCMGPLS